MGSLATDETARNPSIHGVICKGIFVRWFACALCLGLFASGNALFAQDDEARRAAEEARRAAEIARMAEEDRLMRERSIAMMREFLNDTSGARRSVDAGADRRRRFQMFQDAFRDFEAARQKLRDIRASGTATKAPAREMEKSVKDLLDFVKLVNKKHPRLDPAEFKGVTNDALVWETLATADRIAPALTDVIRSEDESSVDIKFLMSLPQLELDLLRLRWMARRLR